MQSFSLWMKYSSGVRLLGLQPPGPACNTAGSPVPINEAECDHRSEIDCIEEANFLKNPHGKTHTVRLSYTVFNDDPI